MKSQRGLKNGKEIQLGTVEGLVSRAAALAEARDLTVGAIGTAGQSPQQCPETDMGAEKCGVE